MLKINDNVFGTVNADTRTGYGPNDYFLEFSFLGDELSINALDKVKRNCNFIKDLTEFCGRKGIDPSFSKIELVVDCSEKFQNISKAIERGEGCFEFVGPLRLVASHSIGGVFDALIGTARFTIVNSVLRKLTKTVRRKDFNTLVTISMEID